MPPWTVYILACHDGSLYTGITNDLDRRLAAHTAGAASRYTRSRLPVRLAYREPAADRATALRREAAIKRLTRADKLALLAGWESSAAPGAARRGTPRDRAPRAAAPRSPRSTGRGSGGPRGSPPRSGRR